MSTIDSTRPANTAAFPKAPAPGTVGNKRSVVANYVEIKKYPADEVFQYDVDIQPANGTFKRLPAVQLLRSIFDSAMNKYRTSKLGNTMMLYDDRKIAYASKRVCGPKEKLTLEVGLPKGGGRMDNFVIFIREAAVIDMSVLENFINKRGNVDITQVQPPLNVLDMVFGSVAKKLMFSFGRSFFTREQSRPTSGGLELWRGFALSARPGEGKMYLNINTVVTAMYIPGPLLEALGELLGASSPTDLAKMLKGPRVGELRTYLTSLSIVLRHKGLQNGRQFSVKSLTTKPLSEVSFEWDDPDNPGKPKQITVVTYYKKRYNISLRFPFLPGIVCRNNTVLPIELCDIDENQRYKRKLDENQTADMVKFACQRPSENQNRIVEALGQFKFNESPILRTFGVSIDSRLSVVESRVLPPPKLIYGKGSREQNIVPSGGAWNMRDKKVSQAGQPLKSWGVLVMARGRFATEPMVRNFINALVNMAKNMGYRVDNPNPIVKYANASGDISHSMRDIGDSVYKSTRVPPQILLVVLPSTNTLTYQLIKNCAYTELGIQTQCMQSKHIGKANPQYCANLMLKINAKLGGINQTLPPNDLQAMLRNNPTIFLGCDVTHPGAGEADAGRPSIASVVGSTDLLGTKYAATLIQLPSRQEIVGKLKEAVVRHLKLFRMKTNTVPKRIVFYRDGVSETQFAQVRDLEIIEIHRACAELSPGYKPEITFLAVLKRHHTRFFPMGRDGDRTGNCVPGTVVDRAVTMPTLFDFYLFPHAAIQGTSRPTHYYVLHDDSKMTQDEIQKLTYNLCYTYAICTRSVSLVPPVYYAHRVADRARCHFVNMSMGEEDDLDQDRDNALPKKMAGLSLTSSFEPKIIDIHNRIATSMYFM